MKLLKAQERCLILNNYTYSQELYHCIFSDYIYQQDVNFNYINAPYLQRTDKNARFKFIQRLVNEIVEKAIPCSIRQLMTAKINPIAFYQAVGKFSRDVYGQKRLIARLKGLENSAQIKEITQYKDYGFKIDSTNPYVHRIASVFLYWFSVIKPFSVEMSRIPKSSCNAKDYEKLQIIYSLFNEYMTYFLIALALTGTTLQLRIDSNWEYFKEFLKDLHFRNLSRSSLEFFLASYQVGLST